MIHQATLEHNLEPHSSDSMRAGMWPATNNKPKEKREESDPGNSLFLLSHQDRCYPHALHQYHGPVSLIGGTVGEVRAHCLAAPFAMSLE